MSSLNQSPLRALFFTEAFLKVVGGTIFILSPSTILKNLISPPYPPISELLIRSLGTQTLAFSIPLFLAARNEKISVQSRRIVYWALLARESFLAVGLLGQLGASYLEEWNKDKEDEGVRVRALEEGLAVELSQDEQVKVGDVEKLRRGMWIWVAELVPFVVGRLWVLQKRDQWF